MNETTPSRTAVAEPARCDVLLEQTLGHVTHGQNLQRLLALSPDIAPTFLTVPFEVDGWAQRVPGYSNWTIRAGVRARRVLMGRKHSADVRFVHTQVPAMLLGRLIRSTPTVISLDATPKQYDELGDHYQHDVGPTWLEFQKHRLHRRCLLDAAHLVAWSQWTKDGLVRDYGVTPDDVTVIPPGVDVGLWSSAPSARGADGIVRILFVGGDLRRKGGMDLLKAFERVRGRHGPTVELHMVTKSPCEASPGVFTYLNMIPNSRELIELYGRCDIFGLPTHGDCLPMVLPEAAAAHLALLSTDVGAIREVVRPDETGLLVEPGDIDALADALNRLVSDPTTRNRLAAEANRLVSRDHDAALNALRLGRLLADVARDGVCAAAEGSPDCATR